MLGTLTYMSPEQIEGGLVDRRSDIFSVGVVLYEVMSSHRAFQGETPSQIIRAILNEQPIGLAERCPELDPAFDCVVRKALHKNQSERYQTLAEMAADLGRIAVAPGAVLRADDPTGTLIAERANRQQAAAIPSVSPVESQPEVRRPPSSFWVWTALAVVASMVALGAGLRLADIAFSKPAATTAATPPAAAGSSNVATSTTTNPPPTDAGPASVVTKETPVEVTPTGPPKKITIAEPPERPKPKIEDKAPEPGPTLTQQAAAIMARNPSTAEQAQAAEIFRKACDAGEAAGCLQGGIMYRNNALVRNLPVAMQMFERACDAGTPQGCTSLGTEYARGVAVAKDEVRAATLFKRACDGGGLIGCGSLGRAYQEGRGVARDDAMARSFYQKACDGGVPAGCLDLGLMLVRRARRPRG